MTDLQSRAKKWLQSLTAEIRARDLREEFFPDVNLSVEEAVHNLETVGMEEINLQDGLADPLEGLPEEFPNPQAMTDEEMGQTLSSAWAILSPSE